MFYPWIGMGVVLAIGVGMMAGLSAYQSKHTLDPELARKVLHGGVGLLGLSFPRLFESAWPVLGVLGMGMLVISGTKVCKFLRCRLGGPLYGITRASDGDLYFLLAIAILFVFSSGNIILYVIPLVIVTFADSAAALVGTRYGRWCYAVGRGNKSIEGSVAFMVVSFTTVYPILLIFGPANQEAVVFAAAALAFTTTMIEAVAGKGLDNFLVPIGAYLTLFAIT
jgi:phytol kinase